MRGNICTFIDRHPCAGVHAGCQWGSSLAGRAPRSQRGGRRFESALLHHFSVGSPKGTGECRRQTYDCLHKTCQRFAPRDNYIVQTAIYNTGIQGVLGLRVGSASVYFLFRGKEAVLIGAGRREHLPLIGKALKMLDLSWTDIRAILLPNADAESFAGLASIREKCEAKVYVHRLEEPRLAMRPGEKSVWNLRRRIEMCRLKRYGNRPCAPDLYISGGDILDMWYGLTVIDLPGYSPGNCGFYCRHLGIVFTGSLPMRPGFSRRMYERLFLDAETISASRAKVIAKTPSATFDS